MPDIILVEATDVSLFWKVTHVSFLTIAGLSGIVSGFSQNLARERFDEKCYVGGQLELRVSSSSQPGDKGFFFQSEFIGIDLVTSIWSSDARCDFTQYTLICSFIFATIWSVFFIMCGPGGRSKSGLPQPWRIVPPALLFSLISFIVVTVATSDFSIGCALFCEHFDAQFKHLTNMTSDTPCMHLNQLLKPTGFPFNTLLTTSEISAWTSVVFWALSFIFLLLRVVFAPDFIIIHVNGKSTTKNVKKLHHNA